VCVCVCVCARVRRTYKRVCGLVVMVVVVERCGYRQLTMRIKKK